MENKVENNMKMNWILYKGKVGVRQLACASKVCILLDLSGILSTSFNSGQAQKKKKARYLPNVWAASFKVLEGPALLVETSRFITGCFVGLVFTWPITVQLLLQTVP